jgi:formylglycine-generating enzyme required for sulfatase activity
MTPRRTLALATAVFTAGALALAQRAPDGRDAGTPVHDVGGDAHDDAPPGPEDAPPDAAAEGSIGDATPDAAVPLSTTAMDGGARARGLDADTPRATALDGGTAAPPDSGATAACPENLARIDRAGHCCAPGQRWLAGHCAGVPSTCPPGYVTGATDAGIACVPRPCEDGRERAADGVHCCWPGQVYRAREGACRGEVSRCPEGTTALGRTDCAPPERVAVEHAPHAAPAGMVFVGGGTFRMGPRQASDARYVTVGPFWIDRTEVTVAAYERCVAAGVCEAASDPFGLARGGAPVVDVTHDMARAYCAWAGGRLPTEAEWELAARGPDGRTYPWGERTPDCTLARLQGCGTGPLAAGTLRAGASPFGALDMAGNVAEWTADHGGPSPSARSHRDPTGPSEGRTRVVRGGAFDAPATALRTFARAERDPREARYDTGFRCVRTAPAP